MTEHFERRSAMPVPPEEVFRWHAREGAIERLSPPWERADLIERSGGLAEGARVVFRLRVGPFAKDWVAIHGPMIEGREFSDRQESGPFASWHHIHRFEPAAGGTSILIDKVEYALPLGFPGRLFGGAFARRKLKALFDYRHSITHDDLEQHRLHESVKRMKILISGSHGLVGSALMAFLTTGGHEVVRLVRGAGESGAIGWNPAKGFEDPEKLAGFDAVVHLAGESIMGRWTESKKQRIRESRIDGTAALTRALAALPSPPKVFVCASAIGFYGDRPGELLTETAAPGTNFLAGVVRDWEAAADPARAAGIRVVNVRFGVILTPKSGALAQMLPPFKMGVGGPIGDGRQVMSWIALDDAVGVIYHTLMTDTLFGPVNAVTPGAVSNAAFSKTLGRVLRRPAFLPLPAFVARLAFGQMADELLLADARVEPAKLRETGYAFRYPDLEAALRHLLGK